MWYIQVSWRTRKTHVHMIRHFVSVIFSKVIHLFSINFYVKVQKSLPFHFLKSQFCQNGPYDYIALTMQNSI